MPLKRTGTAHAGSKVGWIASGTSRAQAFANSTSWSGWPWGVRVWVKGQTKPPWQPSATGALQLGGRARGIEQAQVGDGDEAPAAVPAEVGDPTVVRTPVRERELGVGDLALPEQTDRRVEDALLEVLAIEQLDALARVAGAEGDVVHVATVGAGPRVEVAHRAHHPEGAVLRALARAAVELEVLEAAGVDPNAHRPRLVGGFEIVSHRPAGSRT